MGTLDKLGWKLHLAASSQTPDQVEIVCSRSFACRNDQAEALLAWIKTCKTSEDLAGLIELLGGCDLMDLDRMQEIINFFAYQPEGGSGDAAEVSD